MGPFLIGIYRHLCWHLELTLALTHGDDYLEMDFVRFQDQMTERSNTDQHKKMEKQIQTFIKINVDFTTNNKLEKLTRKSIFEAEMSTKKATEANFVQKNITVNKTLVLKWKIVLL